MTWFAKCTEYTEIGESWNLKEYSHHKSEYIHKLSESVKCVCMRTDDNGRRAVGYEVMRWLRKKVINNKKRNKYRHTQTRIQKHIKTTIELLHGWPITHRPGDMETGFISFLMSLCVRETLYSLSLWLHCVLFCSALQCGWFYLLHKCEWKATGHCWLVYCNNSTFTEL